MGIHTLGRADETVEVRRAERRAHGLGALPVVDVQPCPQGGTRRNTRAMPEYFGHRQPELLEHRGTSGISSSSISGVLHTHKKHTRAAAAEAASQVKLQASRETLQHALVCSCVCPEIIQAFQPSVGTSNLHFEIFFL